MRSRPQNSVINTLSLDCERLLAFKNIAVNASEHEENTLKTTNFTHEHGQLVVRIIFNLEIAKTQP